MSLKQILIVDDDEKQCEIYAFPLTEAHYNVTTFNEPETALAHISAAPPDVLVIDYQMPHLTGVDVLKHTQAEGIEIPVVIMLTGTHLRVTEHVREIQPYVTLMLAKPFDPVKLRDIINKFAADVANT